MRISSPDEDLAGYGDALLSLATQPTFDYCSRDGPRPFLVDLRNAVRTALDRVRGT